MSTPFSQNIFVLIPELSFPISLQYSWALCHGGGKFPCFVTFWVSIKIHPNACARVRAKLSTRIWKFPTFYYAAAVTCAHGVRSSTASIMASARAPPGTTCRSRAKALQAGVRYSVAVDRLVVISVLVEGGVGREGVLKTLIQYTIPNRPAKRNSNVYMHAHHANTHTGADRYFTILSASF